MRKFHNISLFYIFLLIIFLIFPSVNIKAADKVPSRSIYVVYDDSGSMIYTGKTKVDTWCQAKYSMEVFASMLGENDTMKIYVMSDFTDGKSGSAKLTLSGNDGAETNVSKVHSMVTRWSETPFEPVIKAMSDLEKDSADEKWLVILTDGSFNSGIPDAGVDGFIQSKSSDINVVFLGMGASAQAIKGDASRNIFYEHAEQNSEILSKITSICTRIFNYDKLTVNASSGEFDFDVPMSELIVFAQGGNVSVNGLNDPSGGSLSYAGTPVKVMYSEVATSSTDADHSDPIIDRELEGSIATFKGMYDAGSYKADVTNAKTLEIYYKPAVEIMAFLEDGEGASVPYTEGVPAGDYKLRMEFVKAGTDEPVGESSLLGDVKFTAKLSHEGNEDGKEYNNGDMITLEEGDYDIDASAEYLKYHSVSTDLEFTVFCNLPISFEKVKSGSYEIDSDGFVQPVDRIEVKALLDGREFTPEEWDKFDATISYDDKSDKRITLDYEKGDEPGKLYLTPGLESGMSSGSEYGDVKYVIESNVQDGNRYWSGSMHDNISITDSRPWWQKNRDKFIKIAIGLGILFWLLGYIPGIKKYLPKDMPKSPGISKLNSNFYTEKAHAGDGIFRKSKLSTFLPYVPQKGKVYIDPPHNEIMKIKAVSNNNEFEVTNAKSKFAGKSNVLFEKKPLPKDHKGKYIFTSSLSVYTVKRETNGTVFYYKCRLNG